MRARASERAGERADGVKGYVDSLRDWFSPPCTLFRIDFLFSPFQMGRSAYMYTHRFLGTPNFFFLERERQRQRRTRKGKGVVL